jgi:tryptophan synthase beta chain
MSRSHGYFGEFGGQYAPEVLMPALRELQQAYTAFIKDPRCMERFHTLLTTYCGRPTPLYYAENLGRELGGIRLYLKREDLNHTGAHKINNAIGQCLLADYMGKKRIIAETGAGQHGVAVATAAALLNKECHIYMGEEDIRRQRPNVFRMKLLGARVVAVHSGGKTLKDAVNETMRDWSASVRDTHYIIGSTVGPHPFPTIVRRFQEVIGRETKRQIRKREGRLPDEIVACVGGGSNSLGIFSAFVKDRDVALTGVEAGGKGLSGGKHAVRLTPNPYTAPGIFHSSHSYVLQNRHGQIRNTYSLSAGLDYSGVGPEHAWLYSRGRVHYTYATDKDAVAAFQKLCRVEGIIPALESSHALAYVVKNAATMQRDRIVIVNISGRGDKDIFHIAEYCGECI